MANVSKGFQMSRTVTTHTNAGESTTREKSEFDGLWLNPVVTFSAKDEDGNDIVITERFPRGIAVSDLQDFKIYPGTDPDRAKRLRKMNTILQAIREKGLNLDEGESSMVKSVGFQLYRRQETVEHVTGTDEMEAVVEALFGDD